MTIKTSLYRHWDADGRLLYVGISLSALQRLAQHKERSRWFERIASVTIEQFPTREAALAAEREAIATERPECNIIHNAANDNGALKATSPHHTDEAPQHGFLGLFGHTHHDDGEIDWQFEIIREGGDGLYLAQLYSWWDGRPTNIVPMTAGDIVRKGHSLYATKEEWVHQAETSQKKFREIRRRQEAA